MLWVLWKVFDIGRLDNNLWQPFSVSASPWRACQTIGGLRKCSQCLQCSLKLDITWYHLVLPGVAWRRLAYPWYVFRVSTYSCLHEYVPACNRCGFSRLLFSLVGTKKKQSLTNRCCLSSLAETKKSNIQQNCCCLFDLSNSSSLNHLAEWFESVVISLPACGGVFGVGWGKSRRGKSGERFWN